ncbi:methyltransferase domain-containing protein [Streptomyces sp. NPDC051771]|uniref:class I SAM-dependent methyltransferase n=1 Tax=Streptomyces sp. NPDC051771 TaxID=3154847 RepID=UPI00343D6A98
MKQSVESAPGRTELVHREFARQANTFEDSRLNGAFTMHLAGLVDFIAPDADAVCLDSACGTGIVARALAPRVRHVTALDTTPEMIAQGKTQADAEGVANVVFQQGDAARLPFPDDSFSLVVTRFSLHHVASPGAVAAELVRVCRPGGRVVVADMVARPELPGDADRLERLRDPSHGTLLTVEHITGLLTSAGAAAGPADVFDVERPLAPWLEQSLTPEDTARAIERELAEELDGGPATGLRPLRRDGELWFTQTWAHLSARAAA